MRNIAILLVAAGLTFAQVPNPGWGSAPPPNPMDTRGLVDRARNDLGRAADFERHKGHDKEVARYEDAGRNLSDFNRQMTDGHFDKGELDSAIDSVGYVIEHNALDRGRRDALRNDLMDLREISTLHGDD